MIEIIHKLVRVSRRLLQELGREPSDEEIGDEMGITPEKVREIVKFAQAPLSLESPIGEEEDYHLGDFVEDREAVSPSDAAALTMLHFEIEHVLDTLSPRERRVLTLRFGLVDGREATLEEVGKRLGVTRERIRQIEAKAIAQAPPPLALAEASRLPRVERLSPQRVPIGPIPVAPFEGIWPALGAKVNLQGVSDFCPPTASIASRHLVDPTHPDGAHRRRRSLPSG